MRVIFHLEASAEVRDAARFYGDRASGLGERFLAELHSTIQRIQEMPDGGSIVEANVRMRNLRGFPYSVYYEWMESGDLFVMVLRHHSRHPDYWRHRLDD
ncbi:MAG: type II toxin-antitoxin system RelE/ParE family toxin [Planctomycetaceae bacterium]